KRFAQCTQLVLRVAAAVTRREPADGVGSEVALDHVYRCIPDGRGERVERKPHIGIRAAMHAAEVGVSDTDDRERRSTDFDRLTERGGIGIETPLPEPIV